MKLNGLNSKTAAELYTNCEIGLDEEYAITKSISSNVCIGTICGYFDDLIIADTTSAGLCIFTGITENEYRYTRTSTKTPTKRIFRFYNSNLIILNPPKPATVYPSKCSTCYQPSRKFAGFVMCSNVRCKSNKKMRANLSKVKREKLSGWDGNGFIVCPVCSERVINGMRVSGEKCFDQLKCSKCGWVKLTIPLQLKEGMKIVFEASGEKTYNSATDRFEYTSG